MTGNARPDQGREALRPYERGMLDGYERGYDDCKAGNQRRPAAALPSDAGVRPTPDAGVMAEIIGLLNRGNDVREWPSDEQEMHRRPGWESYAHRHHAVMRLRAEKILALAASPPVGSCRQCGGPLTEARTALGLTLCSGACHIAAREGRRCGECGLTWADCHQEDDGYSCCAGCDHLPPHGAPPVGSGDGS